MIIFVLTLIQLARIPEGSSLSVLEQQQQQQQQQSSPESIKPPISMVENPMHIHSQTDSSWWKATMETADSLFADMNLENINATTACGYWKCYYPSRSRPGFGYLIGQRRDLKRKHAEFTLGHLQQGYDLADKLHTKYGIRHFLESPPVSLNCTRELADGLNLAVNAVKNPSNDFNPQYLFRETNPSRVKRDKLLVQVVQQAPRPYIIITLGRVSRIGLFEPRMERFLSEQVVGGWNVFWNHFQDDWNHTAVALKNEPQLYQDFQFLLDASGHIWHIDLDRVWGNEGEHPRNCTFAHEDIEKFIIDPLQKRIKQSSNK